MIDNVKLNSLANQKTAPHRLIKNLADNRRNDSGHPSQREIVHLINCFRQKQQKNLKNEQNSVNCISTEIAMRRRNSEKKICKGGFKPDKARNRGGGRSSILNPENANPKAFGRSVWPGEKSIKPTLAPIQDNAIRDNKSGQRTNPK